MVGLRRAAGRPRRGAPDGRFRPDVDFRNAVDHDLESRCNPRSTGALGWSRERGDQEAAYVEEAESSGPSSSTASTASSSSTPGPESRDRATDRAARTRPAPQTRRRGSPRRPGRGRRRQDRRRSGCAWLPSSLWRPATTPPDRTPIMKPLHACSSTGRRRTGDFIRITLSNGVTAERVSEPRDQERRRAHRCAEAGASLTRWESGRQRTGIRRRSSVSRRLARHPERVDRKQSRVDILGRHRASQGNALPAVRARADHRPV